jgi:anti-sigma factor RsiW
MSCDEYQELMIDFHHGELHPAERRRVAAHLTSCPACAMEYCRLQVDLAGLTESLTSGPRPEVGARLRERVRREFRPPWWRRLLRVGALPIPAYQTALAVAAVLLVWFLVVAPRLSGEHVTARHEPVLTGYDASHIVPLDPNTL